MKRDIMMFVGGAAVGALVSYFVIRKMVEKELIEMENRLMDELHGESGEYVPEVDMAYTEDHVVDYQSLKAAKHAAAQHQKLITRYDTAGLGRLEPVEIDRSKVRGPVDSDEDEDGPRIIDIEEYASGNPNHDKLTLYWYSEDEVLADDNEEPVDDIVGWVGPDTLTMFDEDEDQPKVYVCNPRISTDFEIIKLELSYAEVMGIEPKGSGDGENE